jgi:hypothetical protein
VLWKRFGGDCNVALEKQLCAAHAPPSPRHQSRSTCTHSLHNYTNTLVTSRPVRPSTLAPHPTAGQSSATLANACHAHTRLPCTHGHSLSMIDQHAVIGPMGLGGNSSSMMMMMMMMAVVSIHAMVGVTSTAATSAAARGESTPGHDNGSPDGRCCWLQTGPHLCSDSPRRLRHVVFVNHGRGLG